MNGKASKGEKHLMKKNEIALHRVVWCKIRYWQRLHDASDETLARYLLLSPRTLREYDHDAGNLSLKQIENFLEATGLTLEQLTSF